MTDAPLVPYDGKRARHDAAFGQGMATADTSGSVAEPIFLAASDKAPRLRDPSGKAVKQGAFARRFLLRSLFDMTLQTQFGLAFKVALAGGALTMA